MDKHVILWVYVFEANLFISGLRISSVVLKKFFRQKKKKKAPKPGKLTFRKVRGKFGKKNFEVLKRFLELKETALFNKRTLDKVNKLRAETTKEIWVAPSKEEEIRERLRRKVEEIIEDSAAIRCAQEFKTRKGVFITSRNVKEIFSKFQSLSEREREILQRKIWIFF